MGLTTTFNGHQVSITKTQYRKTLFLVRVPTMDRDTMGTSERLGRTDPQPPILFFFIH